MIEIKDSYIFDMLKNFVAKRYDSTFEELRDLLSLFVEIKRDPIIVMKSVSEVKKEGNSNAEIVKYKLVYDSAVVDIFVISYQTVVEVVIEVQNAVQQHRDSIVIQVMRN
jgi:hypothetical protein